MYSVITTANAARANTLASTHTHARCPRKPCTTSLPVCPITSPAPVNTKTALPDAFHQLSRTGHCHPHDGDPTRRGNPTRQNLEPVSSNHQQAPPAWTALPPSHRHTRPPDPPVLPLHSSSPICIYTLRASLASQGDCSASQLTNDSPSYTTSETMLFAVCLSACLPACHPPPGERW